MGSDSSLKFSRSHCSLKKLLSYCCAICFIIILILLLPIFVQLYNDRFIGKGTYYSSNCWVPAGRKSCAPQFIIAGAMKSGTTSLWSYLLNHPQVLALSQSLIDPKGLHSVVADKEIRFFSDPTYTSLVKEYGKAEAIGYYFDLFPIILPPGEMNRDLMLMTNNDHITGDATPMYIKSPANAHRVKEALPFVKVLVLLRNPIDRAYSDYWFQRNLQSKAIQERKGFEPINHTHDEIFQKCIETEIEIAYHCEFSKWANNPTFQDALGFLQCTHSLAKDVFALNKTANNNFCSPSSRLSSLCIDREIRRHCSPMALINGLYAPQVLEWVETFQDSILILPSEDLFDNPSDTMKYISEFLEIDYFNWNTVTKKTYNIINPKSVAGSQLELVTNNPNSKHFQIGKSDSTSDYPPLNPSVRNALIEKMKPFNEILSKLLNSPSLISKWK